jgi:hypothetical protein
MTSVPTISEVQASTLDLIAKEAREVAEAYPDNEGSFILEMFADRLIARAERIRGE